MKSVKAAQKAKLRNLKVHDRDWRTIQARAKKYAGGNVSLWLRCAGLNYAPKASARH